jgi:hypothetical protein
MIEAAMKQLTLGVSYGAGLGALAWLVGWAIGKIIKMFRYVAR